MLSLFLLLMPLFYCLRRVVLLSESERSQARTRGGGLECVLHVGANNRLLEARESDDRTVVAASINDELAIKG